MELNLLFLLTVVPAIILYGIAKSGLGGSISLISVPLMTIVMPLSQALAIILQEPISPLGSKLMKSIEEWK